MARRSKLAGKKFFTWLGVIDANNQIPLTSRQCNSIDNVRLYEAYIDGRFLVDVCKRPPNSKKRIWFSSKTTPVGIYKGQTKVGNIIRTSNKKFSLTLFGKYWKNSEDKPNPVGGAVDRRFDTLTEAKEAATKFA